MLQYDVNFVDGSVSVLSRLSRLDYSTPLKQSCAYMEQITKLRFATETDPNGDKWQALKPETLRKKRSGSILRETGLLSNSISSRIVGNVGYIGTNIEYARFHQFGTRFMPRRQYLGFNVVDVARINSFFVRHLSSGT